jgi:hypothetical protein
VGRAGACARARRRTERGEFPPFSPNSRALTGEKWAAGEVEKWNGVMGGGVARRRRGMGGGVKM